MSNPVPSTYLGDAVYAEFSNNMIGLMLNSHETLSLVWLEKEVYQNLKNYAKRVGWEPPDVLPEELPEFAPVIHSMKETLSYSTRRLHTWLKAQPLYLDIYKALVEKAQLKEAVFSWDTIDFNIMFSGTGHHLAQVFRVLRTSGFELEGERPRAKSSSWTGRFKHPETTARIRISFASTVCRMEQVRTELKEVPVYDIVCDEGTSDEDRAELDGSPRIYPPRTPDQQRAADLAFEDAQDMEPGKDYDDDDIPF